MLIELRIRNVAVIDAVSLPLTAGLNVLTGETGAGKSLVVGALGMLLGERAASDRVRPGTDTATVEGVFELRSSDVVKRLLDERGIESDDDVLVLKREISANGRSRAWINGSPVTAAVLAEVGARLLTVHGQHDSRQLLDADHQRELLDAFAGALEERSRVSAAYGARLALVNRERELEVRRAEAQRRADYLRFVVREIDDARPVRGEDDVLDSEIRKLSHGTDLRNFAAQAAAGISGDDRAVLARLAAVRRHLTALSRIDPETTRWETILDEAVYALEELSRELEAYAESIDADPDRLRKLELRRDLLLSLTRKYGPTLEDVVAMGAQSREALELVDGGEIDLKAIAEARASADGALAEAAAQLTRKRKAGALQLGALVQQLLPELGMPEARFVVTLQSLDQVSEAGAESVQFVAALNPGAELRSLARIASGGELSRVMLALSTVLARLQQTPTLVFDEIDAGIGGTVAWQVGGLMRRVAAHHQVLAISHLAQIAARADHHVVVRKGAVGTVTTADTTVVTADERVVEIARMLGGDAEREVSRAHARELLERGAADDHIAALPHPPESGARRTGQRRGKPV